MSKIYDLGLGWTGHRHSDGGATLTNKAKNETIELPRESAERLREILNQINLAP